MTVYMEKLKHVFVPRPGDPSYPYCEHWNESSTGDTKYGRIDMKSQCGYPRSVHIESEDEL